MRRATIGGIGALTAIFIVCTWTGIDFGGHWDERPWFFQPAATAVGHGTLLPGTYLYPSMLHDVIVTAAIPELIRRRDVAVRAIESKAFLLRVRRIVAVISALTIVWVGLLVLVWRESPLESLLAAAIAAGSWELQYHSRWVTVDPLVVQFGALTLLCAVAGYRRRSVWLLRASAIAAGLGCSSKYPAGLLLLTVLVACWFSEARLRRIVEALVLFAAAFFITTPGALLQTPLLLDGLLLARQNYASGWGMYTVSVPGEHARLLAEYIALVLFSHTPAIAAFLALAVLGGAIVVAREDRRLAFLVLSFPVAYLLYFSTQRIMVVRNVLVVMPFLAVLAGIGIGTLLKRGIRARGLRIVAAAGVAAMLIVNLAWLWTAARTIKRPPRVYVAQLAEYLDAHSDRRFAYSPRVIQELRAFDHRELPFIPPEAPGVDEVVFFALESPSLPLLPNRRDSVECWFGAHEINFNYYPTWVTADRILVMKPRKVLWLNGKKTDA
jgi:hypothetical protein